MPKIPTLKEMLKSGVHFGHQVSKRHPQMEPYIFTAKNGIHIINLEKTQKKLEKALDFVKETTAKGGIVLFLGTKKQAQNIVKKYAQECGMPYVVERWLGGTLTNFSIILKLLNKFNDLKQKQESGELEKYTKKEQLEFSREIEKLEKIVGGIKDLKKIPEAVYVVDIKREKTAVREAKKKKVDIVSICDTNVNPRGIDYIIPANDDATKSIELITGLMAEAVKEGKELAKAGGVEEDSKDKKKKEKKDNKKEQSE